MGVHRLDSGYHSGAVRFRRVSAIKAWHDSQMVRTTHLTLIALIVVKGVATKLLSDGSDKAFCCTVNKLLHDRRKLVSTIQKPTQPSDLLLRLWLVKKCCFTED